MRKLHFSLLCIFMLSITLTIKAQYKTNSHLPLGQKEAIVFRKNFPFLYYCYTTPAVSSLLQKDTTLRSIAVQYREQLQAVLSSKPAASDTFAVINTLALSDSIIEPIQNRLTQLHALYPQVFGPLNQWLEKTGAYPATDALHSMAIAWMQDAQGINFTIGVYGKGYKPNYPMIDSCSFNVHDRSYREIQDMIGRQVYKETDSLFLFFGQPLFAALRLLEFNGRYNIADFEPMEQTVNAAAIARIKTTNWKKYPYTHIHVPGAGTENREDSINPVGILRCRLAAIQYYQGRAPFIVVSGGRVHPYKINYSEAEEMKKYLVNELGIPASAVIMEPHARHTTTNLRNTAKLLIKYGIPMDIPGIICTTLSQAGAILSPAFEKRCMKELGYIPYRLGKQLSDTETEYYALPVSLRINPTEPLDP